MIKNVIFDFGNVLTKFDSLELATDIMGGDREAGLYLQKNTVNNTRLWDKYDAGLCSEEEIISLLCSELQPKYHSAVAEFVKTFETCFTQYDEMVPIVSELKSKGIKTFLLSNFPKEMFARVAPRCPILDMLDAQTVSSAIHMVKPEAEIFEYILGRYGLVPQETLFADDYAPNVRSAESLGIHAHLFTTAEAFRECLKKLCIL